MTGTCFKALMVSAALSLSRLTSHKGEPYGSWKSAVPNTAADSHLEPRSDRKVNSLTVSQVPGHKVTKNASRFV